MANVVATLVTLENKLNTLVTWIQDDSVSPADRFQLLQEIAEEAARYKLGGDDKIRVSAGACDGVSFVTLLRPPTLLILSSYITRNTSQTSYRIRLFLHRHHPHPIHKLSPSQILSHSPIPDEGYSHVLQIRRSEGGATPLLLDQERQQRTRIHLARRRSRESLSWVSRTTMKSALAGKSQLRRGNRMSPFLTTSIQLIR